MILHGDCINKMKELDDNSVDAIVTDPPYELGFMGKKWDASGIAYNVELWKECLRVLKPGGHLLAFGGTRTYHRMTCAIEDAGFEIRDMLEWIYASGFPKSLNIGKAVDKKMGNERELVGSGGTRPIQTSGRINAEASQYGKFEREKNILTKGSSEWEGWGTALKPAHEPIVLARKPLSEKTIVENCIKHGTGGLNIDGCRIPTSDNTAGKTSMTALGQNSGWNNHENKEVMAGGHGQGRFPANLLVTDDALNDGEMTKHNSKDSVDDIESNVSTFGASKSRKVTRISDSGSKSRYFDIDVWGEKHGLIQTPKASKKERNAGCEGLPTKTAMELTGRKKGSKGLSGSKEHGNSTNPFANSGSVLPRSNHHPTVKPLHLISWLVRLVSKKGDTVLDPFMGSGTTGVSCKQLDRNFIGIELNEEYIVIAEKRIAHQPIQKEMFT